MHGKSHSTFLLASPEPALLAAVEPVLLAAGAKVEVVLTAEAVLTAMQAAHAPELALLDAKLPGMPMGQLLAALRSETGEAGFPIVLFSDSVQQEWVDRLADGVIDDLILRGAETAYWQLRLERTLRTHRLTHELETLREVAALNAQLDQLTGVYNREAMLSLMFRETDRVLRLKQS